MLSQPLPAEVVQKKTPGVSKMQKMQKMQKMRQAQTAVNRNLTGSPCRQGFCLQVPLAFL